MTRPTIVHQVLTPIGACEMITYVLILVLASPYKDNLSPSMATAEFAGQKACERAAYDMQELMGRQYDVTAVCLPQSLK